MPAAVITGGDSGIGRATAELLASRGWDVGITYRSDAEGAREVPAVARQLELTDFDAIPGAVGELADALGGLDCFVNNAGGGQGGELLDLGLEDWRQVVDVNLTGAFVALQAAARRMVDAGRGGRLVAVTSVHEHVPLAGAGAYVTAKHGLGGLVKTMAYELASHGITVNAVAPGEIVTPLTQGEGKQPAASEVDRPFIPLGRPGEPSEVAELIAWVASEASSYVTGASLVVDGGLTQMAAIPNQQTGD